MSRRIRIASTDLQSAYLSLPCAPDVHPRLGDRMSTPRPARTLILALGITLAILTLAPLGRADDKAGKLRFGVGPLQPTPTETKKAYEPFFAYVARQLNREYDLTATTDWAGI